MCSALWEPYLTHPFNIIYIVSRNFRNMSVIDTLHNEKICYSSVWPDNLGCFLLNFAVISHRLHSQTLSDALTGRRQRVVYFWIFDLPYMKYSMNDIFFCVFYDIFCNHHSAFSYHIQYFPLSAICLCCSYFDPGEWFCRTGVAVLFLPDWYKWKRKCKEMWNFCQKEVNETLEL